MVDNKTKKTTDIKPTTKEKPAEPTQKPVVKKDIKVSANLEKIIDQVEKLTVIELADLVKALEDKFGVSAAPVAAVAATNNNGADADDQATSEKSEYQLILSSAGVNKISVIKALREINQELGLKEAKDLTEATPKEVGTFKKEEAEAAKKKLEAAGAQVELK